MIPRPLALIALMRWIVPSGEREAWRREWAGEFEFAQRDRSRRGAAPPPSWAARRLWAAWQHAWYLRWHGLRLDTLLQDVRHGARALRRRPGFTTAAVLTLALGIGGTTVIFSALRAVLWRPLPFADPDRLVMLASAPVGIVPIDGSDTASPPDFTDWRQQSTTIASMTAIRDDSYALTADGPAEQVTGSAVTGDFFAGLGLPAALGRVLGSSDGVVGAPDVAVMSDRLWRRRYGQDRTIVGRRITVDGVSVEVVGVMPPEFDYPLDSELWTPLRFTTDDLATQRGAHYLTVIGRLRPSASFDAAGAEMVAIGARLANAYPKSSAHSAVSLLHLRQAMVGDVQPALRLLFGAVGLVFLVACVNVASLVLGSAMTRRRDLAVRAALGAGRGRLVRGLFVESSILALLGGLTGLAIAAAGVRLIAAADRTDIALLKGTRIDAAVLTFTALATGAAAVLFGAWPAWQASRRDGAPHLSGAGARTGGRDASRARNVLVSAEIAMAVALLVGAGLLGRSFLGLIHVPLGMDLDHLQTAAVSLPDPAYHAPGRRTLFVEDVLGRLSALGDVRSAAATFGLPLTSFGYYITVASIDGTPVPADSKELSVEIRTVTPRFFETVGTPVVAGRDFATTDRRGSAPVVIVNRRAAGLLWPSADALGHRVTVSTRLGLGGDRAGGEVVGVVGDIHDVGPAVDPRATLYLSEEQWPMGFLRLVVKPRGEPTDLVASMRAVVAAVDPSGGIL